MREMVRNPIDRLLKQREIKDCGYLTPCWLWTGSSNAKVEGYGVITYLNINWYVHRLAYKLFKNDFNNELCVLHKCDMRICFNPDHLFQGTKGDNNIDTSNKQRCAGQKKLFCKHGHELTEENTYLRKNKNGRDYRSCRLCMTNYNRSRYSYAKSD